MSAVYAPPSAEPRWYRQFWPWVLLGLPATAVVASLATFWIASRDPDGVIAEDYYKQGLAINVDQGRSIAAAKLGLHGDLALDADNGRLVVGIAAETAGVTLPVTLTLRLLHATRSGIDLTLPLQRVAPGRYEAALPVLAAGRWNLQLTADAWRLDGSLSAPHETAVSLLPLVELEPAEH